MKKSTILLLTALVFFLCTLTAFNTIMKAEFETGHYKDPYYEFVSKDYTGFNAVEVHGGSRVSVRIIQGEHKVSVHNRAQEFLQFKKVGNKLVVEVNQQNNDFHFFGDHSVLISCPNLISVTTNGNYIVKGKSETDLASDYMRNKVKVEGFQQDSLLLTQDHATRIELSGNKLEKLTAVVGQTIGSTSVLDMNKSNQIQAAAFKLMGKGSLNLKDVVIPAITYQFSDSANVNLTGAALTSLNKR